mgnify:CR=1 FL=1
MILLAASVLLDSLVVLGLSQRWNSGYYFAAVPLPWVPFGSVGELADKNCRSAALVCGGEGSALPLICALALLNGLDK